MNNSLLLADEAEVRLDADEEAGEWFSLPEARFVSDSVVKKIQSN